MIVNLFGKCYTIDLSLDQQYLRSTPVNSEEGAPMGIGIWYEMFISNPVSFLFKNADPRGSLAANVGNATVRCLSNMKLADMLENRHTMSLTVRKEVSPQSEEWGYKLGSVYIRKVHFRDAGMMQQIEEKVVNRLRQVTSAIKQDGANQVSIITSTAQRQAAIAFAQAAAMRPEIVGSALEKIIARSRDRQDDVRDSGDPEHYRWEGGDYPGASESSVAGRDSGGASGSGCRAETMRKRHEISNRGCLVILAACQFGFAATLRLEDLPLSGMRQDWGTPSAGKSVEGNQFSIGGRTFDHGVGTHAASTWWIDLHGAAQRFTASVGVDDEVRIDPQSANAVIEFKLIGDHKTLFRSGEMHAGNAAKTIDIGLTGVHALVLQVDSLGPSIDYAHADWANAQITYSGRRPEPLAVAVEKAEILTPEAPASPRINGAQDFRRSTRSSGSLHDRGNGRAADDVLRGRFAGWAFAGYPDWPNHGIGGNRGRIRRQNQGFQLFRQR